MWWDTIVLCAEVRATTMTGSPGPPRELQLSPRDDVLVVQLFSARPLEAGGFKHRPPLEAPWVAAMGVRSRHPDQDGQQFAAAGPLAWAGDPTCRGAYLVE